MAEGGQKHFLSQGLDKSPSLTRSARPIPGSTSRHVMLPKRSTTFNGDCDQQTTESIPLPKKGARLVRREEIGGESAASVSDDHMGSSLHPRHQRTSATNTGNTSSHKSQLQSVLNRQSEQADVNRLSFGSLGGSHAAPSRSSDKCNQGVASPCAGDQTPTARTNTFHNMFVTSRSTGSNSLPAFHGPSKISQNLNNSATLDFQPPDGASKNRRCADKTSSMTSQSQLPAAPGEIVHVNSSPSSTEGHRRLAVAEMEGDSEVHKTIVSLIWHKGVLGASVYNTEAMKLQVVQDITESSDFSSTCQLILQTQADIIVTGSKQDPRFLDMLTNLVRDGVQMGNSPQLFTLTNEDLGYEICKRRLIVACESSLARGLADKEAFIKSTINLNFLNMVRAAGGLLKYLELNAMNLALNDQSDVPVLTIALYVMSSQVWMDANTYSMLRILHLAGHPSTALGCHYTREGFSLYGLMDRCKTSEGKKKLKELFLRPSRDIRLLNERLDSLEYLTPSKTSEFTQVIKTNLSKLRNMSKIVARMKNGELKSSDWLALHRVLCSLVLITGVCKEYRDDLPILSKLSDHQTSLQSAAQILFDILDVEQTRLTKVFSIKANYDEEMDRLVQRQRDLPDLLAEKLTSHINEVKQAVRSAIHIHYSSQLGCMLMVDITARMERTGNYSIPGLKLEFLRERNAYYSSDFTREISEMHGSVNTDISDRALGLMYQLQNTLLPEMASMLTALELCAQLDCLISLSSYCFEHNYVRPELNEQDVLSIKGGRHALLDAQIDDFISNDTVSGPGADNSRMMIVTGPNGSGKSVYLKQTVLIVYLAHIGCLVPAKSANIFLADALLTHFPTTDSINYDASTFTADLNKMAAIVTNATGKSLVVLDEFGKGTCPIDGTSMLLSLFQHWLASGLHRCPHVLTASHFHVICRANWIKESSLISLKTLETDLDNGKMVYLYELVNGASGTSHAAAVAQLLDIPRDCLVHGTLATDQFGLTRQGSDTSHSKLMECMSSVVRQMLELDLKDEKKTSGFLNSVLSEQ